MKDELTHIDEEVKFQIEGKALNGILTHPLTDGPHLAIVLLHGSDRSPKEDPYYKTHADNLVQSGVAVLRYDGPGWCGKGSTASGFETLEDRTEEAIAVVQYLQSHPSIQPDEVGLWGISQGGWICQMAAAAYEGVAFIIPTSGPGVTPAEQEVFRVEKESRADGFNETEIAKAVLMRRLMVDIVLPDPVYQTINQSETKRLGDGPWIKIVEMIYSPNPIDPTIEFKTVLDLLQAIKDETWTKFLHLDQVLQMFESLPPQAWETAKEQVRLSQEVDPAEYLTKVQCPVLAIFGEADTSIPVEKSVALYKKYLDEAGNNAVTIKVFPNANHTIQVGGEFSPGYFDLINTWLTKILLN